MEWDDKREPIELAAGDTVYFHRPSWGRFTPGNGFSLLYVGEGVSPVQWTSQLDASGAGYLVNIPVAISQQYSAGIYYLTGYAINGTTGERHKFYYNILTVWPNAQTMQAGNVVKTFNQQMVEKCQELFLKLACDDLNDTTVEGVRARHELRLDTHKLYAKFFQARKGELARLAAHCGKPTGRLIRPLIQVCTPYGTRAGNEWGPGFPFIGGSP